MLAGALAGISEHTVIYPVDAIKVSHVGQDPATSVAADSQSCLQTRMQVLPSLSPSALLAQGTGANSSTLTASSSLMSHLRHASTTQSLRTLWRGVASVIMGAGPAHAMHFGTYEFVKEVAGGDREGIRGVGGTALAGAMATTASDAFMNPFDGESPRLSVCTSNYRTSLPVSSRLSPLQSSNNVCNSKTRLTARSSPVPSTSTRPKVSERSTFPTRRPS